MAIRSPLCRLAILAAGLFLAAACAGPPLTQTAGSCAGCHETGRLLPAGHAKVAEDGIAPCLACHEPTPGAPGPARYAVRMHREHTAAGVECATCHTWNEEGRFGLVGYAGSLTTLDADDFARVKKAAESWANSRFLDSLHAGKARVACGGCHGTQLIPDDNETALNRQCVSCHGTNAQMAEKAKSKHPHINPHRSHLGDIACTVCHQGHQASQAYCLGCHTNFVIPIPGGAGGEGRSRS
jgi:hypothetical protein